MPSVRLLFLVKFYFWVWIRFRFYKVASYKGIAIFAGLSSVCRICLSLCASVSKYLLRSAGSSSLWAIQSTCYGTSKKRSCCWEAWFFGDTLQVCAICLVFPAVSGIYTSTIPAKLHTLIITYSSNVNSAIVWVLYYILRRVHVYLEVNKHTTQYLPIFIGYVLMCTVYSGKEISTAYCAPTFSLDT